MEDETKKEKVNIYVDKSGNKIISMKDMSCFKNVRTKNPELCSECGLGFANKKILHVHKLLVHINPHLEGEEKKVDKPKTLLLIKNPQF